MKTTVKILKTLCLSGMIGLLVISVYGQTDSSVLGKLKKTWQMQGMTGKTAGDEYLNDRIKHYFNDICLGESEYYLSDSVVTVFDSNKVGRILNGRYIISRIFRDKEDKRPKPVGVLEIVELGNEKLILKYIKQPNSLLEYKAK